MPRSERIQRLVPLIARLGLAAVFLVAAVPKLADPASFAQAIGNYHLLPDAWVRFVAVLLPATELALSVGLLARPLARGSALLATLLLVGFAAAMGQALVRGIDLSCGCFGEAASSEVSWWLVLRNLALGAVALWVALPRRRQ